MLDIRYINMTTEFNLELRGIKEHDMRALLRFYKRSLCKEQKHIDLKG